MHDPELMAQTGAGFVLNENVAAVNSIPLTGDGVRLSRKLGTVSDGMELMLTSYCDGEWRQNKQVQHAKDKKQYPKPNVYITLLSHSAPLICLFP